MVRHFEQRHPGRSFAYSFEKNGVKVVYATDNEIDLTVLNPDDILKRPEAMRRVPEEFVRFVADADLLIADGQYTDEEYPRRSAGATRAPAPWSISRCRRASSSAPSSITTPCTPTTTWTTRSPAAARARSGPVRT